MKKLFFSLALVSITIPALRAQEQAATSSPESYLRSSLYTIIIQSNEQDKILEEESQKQGSGTSLIKSLAGTDKKRAENDNIDVVKAPQLAFASIPIPDQFNNHNLGVRIINYEQLLEMVTDDDRKEFENAGAKKKGGFGKFMGALAQGATASVGLDNPNSAFNNKFDKDAPAVLSRFFKNNHVADSMVAKWFNYNNNAWDMNYIAEKGSEGLKEEEKQAARLRGMETNAIESRGRKLLENTYFIAFNLRFRSNQAIVAEAEAIAKAVGSQFGGYGSLAALAVGAGAGAAAGDGFQVQTQAYLFRLVWNPEIETKFAEEIFAKNASLEDLINSGICKLEFVGKEKASARVRQSITNTTPQSVLVGHATERAIDNSYAKLQEKFEVFRTAFPISKSENGEIFARVGMKEGIEAGDEYEILEETEDKNGNIVWKKIGTAKAVKEQIWDNRAGAAEDFANMTEEEKAKEKDYTSLGFTTFKGGKKNQDYTGYYLRLKKKK